MLDKQSGLCNVNAPVLWQCSMLSGNEDGKRWLH